MTHYYHHITRNCPIVDVDGLGKNSLKVMLIGTTNRVSGVHKQGHMTTGHSVET